MNVAVFIKVVSWLVERNITDGQRNTKNW